MATFKVGDRVRIVKATSHIAHLVGMEAVVTEIGDYAGINSDGCFRRYCYRISCQGWPRGLVADGTDIEPIKPLPSIADILAMEGLPSFDCPLVVEVGR